MININRERTLFERLTNRRHLETFQFVDKAARGTPIPLPGVEFSFDERDFVSPSDQRHNDG
jgi:hypothetical protein